MVTIISKNMNVTPSALGGKASGLVKLFEHGLTIPMTIILDIQTLQAVCGNARKIEDITASLALDHKKRYAVRSSVDVEDGTTRSYAGLFDSYLNVQANELARVIARYCESVQETRDSMSRYDAPDAHSLQSALIIQEMIYPSTSGICFTTNPQTNDPNEFMIELCEGLSEGLTSGEITPVNVTVSKSNQEVLNITGKSGKCGWFENFDRNKEKFLTDCKLIEAIFKTAVDIEWAMEGNRFFFLQARPITTIGKSYEC